MQLMVFTCSAWEVESQVPLEGCTGGHLGNLPGPIPHLIGEESQGQRGSSRVIQLGRTEPGISSNVFSLLGSSYKGSHTTGLAALEVSGSKETLWLMHVN